MNRLLLPALALVVLAAGCSSNPAVGAPGAVSPATGPAAHDHGSHHHGSHHHGSHHHGPAAPAPPQVPGAVQIGVIGTDQLQFLPARLQLKAATPAVVILRSVGTDHDLVVDEVGFHLAAAVGQSAQGVLSFDTPGTYTAYCSIPGHRDAGMEIDIQVR